MDLSNEEIKQIIDESKKPEYSDPGILHVRQSRLSIFKFNRKNKLILIHGDENVGCEHIISRHSLLSRKQKWQKNGKLTEEGTKFPIEVTQNHYMNIAETIYKLNNKKIKENSNKDRFEVYEGDVKTVSNELLRCRLVVYKDTGIIQSLFPLVKKKEYNRKRIIPFKQAFCDESLDLLSEIHTIFWSYINKDKFEEFKVVVRKIEGSNVEYWHIQKNSKVGDSLFTTYPGIKLPSLELGFGFLSTYINYYNKENVEMIEKKIKQMID